MAAKMEERILEVRKAGDSVGGVVMCRVSGLPLAWECRFSAVWRRIWQKAMLIPATKGFEVGSGFGDFAERGDTTTSLSTKAEGLYGDQPFR